MSLYKIVLGLLLVFTVNTVFGQRFYQNPIVKEIRFQGLMNTDSSQIKDLIYIHEGERFNEKSFNRSIKLLSSLDMFKWNVEGFINETEEGLLLTFSVKENPYLKQIKYEGNSSIRKDDLDEIMTIEAESYYTVNKRDEAIKAIQRKYEDDGFVEVSVSYKLMPLNIKENHYELIFNIKEGKKIVVEKIVITGNENIQSSEIKGMMKTKERAFIIQSGVLKQEDFDEDRKRLEMFYQQKGYLDIDIKRFEHKIETVGKDKDVHKAIVVYVAVSEGEKYYIDGIKISGNELYKDEELYKMISLKKGDIYDKLKMEQLRYLIYSKYSDNGYLYANVSLVMDKNTNARSISTEYVIFEGPRAHIEEVNITGNTKTKAYVVERELLFQGGELFIRRRIATTRDRLMQLGYFKNVDYDFKPGSAEGLINLDVSVEEQRTGLVTFGVGYGTESGFNGTASVSEKNLFGTGRVLTFKGEYGQRRQLLELSFTEPWLFNTPTFAGVSISFSHQLYDNIPVDDNGDGIIDGYTNSDGTPFNYLTNPTDTISSFTSTNQYYKWNLTLGGNISRRFWVFWEGFVSYAFSMYRDMEANFTTPLVYSDRWQTNTDLLTSITKDFTLKHTIGIGITRNTTDHPMTPSRGLKFNFNTYFNGGFMGGDIHYIRPKASLNFYFNPFWKAVVASHVSTEALLPQINFGNSTNSLVYDSSDRLWFDGVYEMRGWQNYAKRGEAKAFYSTEFRFPIFGQELWGVTFFDIGALWANYNDWSFNGDSYLSSFGIGITINIPMLPIRLYLARKAYYDTTLAKWQLDTSQTFFENWQLVFSIQGLF